MKFFSKCRNYHNAWNIRFLSVSALTISNIILTVRLLHSSPTYSHTCAEQPAPVTTLPFLDCPEYNISFSGVPLRKGPFRTLDLRLGRWDKARNYKIFDNVVVGTEFGSLNQNYSVCVAAQTSLDRMGSLVDLAKEWTGPISVSVFAVGDDELHLLQIYIEYLQKCFKVIREQVAFHLVFPKVYPPTMVKDVDLELDVPHYDCNYPLKMLSVLEKMRVAKTKAWHTKNPYPQNHLRNVARKACQNQYVFLVDIDIIPSKNMARRLDKFLKEASCSGKKCAYVIPTYEIDKRALFPKSKPELISLAQRGLSRPFHQKVFIYNQYATNFSRWQLNTTDNIDVHISHIVNNFEFLYEPFYVAKDDVPEHDERFIGYGFTRNTQVYEMFVAGYDFLVLSPVFTCHWGLQNRRHQVIREQQNNNNGKLVQVFKREVFAKYNKDPLKFIQNQNANIKKKKNP